MPGEEISMQNDEMVKAAAAEFPATFGLRAYPGRLFRIEQGASFVSQGVVLLYVYAKRDESIDGIPSPQWLAFCKGTGPELAREIVPAPAGVR